MRYWENNYELIPGIQFRFRKMNPIEHLDMMTINANKGKIDPTALNEMCLKNAEWSKDGKTWRELIDSNNNTTLPEYDDHLGIVFDLILKFKQDVVEPVFQESKIFQNLMSEDTLSKGKTNSGSQTK